MIKKYVSRIRNMVPYIKECAKETARESVIGLALAGALWTGIGVFSIGFSKNQEQQYNIWEVKRDGNSVIAEKRMDFMRYVRLIDKEGDGIVDAKYISALPRPGCFGDFKPSELDQKIFDELTRIE